MDIGRLNRRITIQRKSVTQETGYGTEQVTWVALATRIRYRSDVTSDMRVILHTAADRTCQIVGGPAELGRREWLEFVVAEYSTK